MDSMSPAQQEALKLAIQDGLPLTPRPYDTLAQQLGLSEQAVIDTLQQWQDSGLIKRFGLVVNHHSLGYRANAMVVWDVADDSIERIAALFAATDEVTLCYQRPRVLPHWPYNLFCMIHGTDRSQVRRQIDALVQRHQLQHIAHDVLFSTRQFKQTGGQFADPELAARHG
jgi:DNA-binding Lrp family transcriptional regulator